MEERPAIVHSLKKCITENVKMWQEQRDTLASSLTCHFFFLPQFYVICDEPRSQGLSSPRPSLAPGGGKTRDPGNEVDL